MIALRRVGNVLQRLDATGKIVPFADGVQDVAVGRFGPLGDSGRSLTVAPNGDVYLMRIAGENGVANRVVVFGADGKLKHNALIDGLGIGDAGLSVDARGNVYLGANIKPSTARLPGAFRGKVPESNWLTWVVWTDQFRSPPWYYSMRNEYLYHYGSVLKFGPQGGKIFGQCFGGAEPFVQHRPDQRRVAVTFRENAPSDALEYHTGYLYHRLAVQGLKWRFAGTGILPSSERYWGDPSCVCYFSRLDGDAYGRVFAPDCFQFRVHMLDANGNLLGHVGQYGNADDAVDGPAVRFAWPGFVHHGVDGKLYVSDGLNGQIVVVGFDYADESVTGLATK